MSLSPSPLTTPGENGSRFGPAPRAAAMAGVVALLAALLAWQGPALAAWQVCATGAVAALSAVVLARPVLVPFFGPIFFHDLVTTARRGRQVLLRCLYILGLMLMVLFLYWESSHIGQPSRPTFAPAEVRRAELAQFNERFFQAFMAVQFLVVVLLTPGLCAGAIADERERKTLDYLLTTDLHNREIVLGKLLARMLSLGLILFAGLPVISLMQLLGGVDPNLMAAGFVATLVTMLSLAALSLCNSVYCTRPRTAMALTYLQVAAYLLLSTAGLGVWGVGTLPPPVRVLGAGNIFVSFKTLQASVAAPTPAPWPMPGPGPGLTLWALSGPAPAPVATLASVLPGVLLGYVFFHLAVAALALTGATLGLRVWSRWQASARGRRSFLITFTQKRLPPIGSRPLWWKEVHAEPLFRLGKAAMIVITTSVTMSLFFGAFLLIAAFAVGSTLGTLPRSMNGSVRALGTFLATLSLLGIAVRSAGAIGGERDRQTLDSLLTAPVENRAIVSAKWWGSVLGVRKAVYCLLVVYLVGVATGGLSLLALPLLGAAWLALAGFTASLGLWFSLVSRTTLRATVWTLATLAAAWLGHWLLSLCCSPLALAFPTRGPGFYEALLAWQMYALTPPAAFHGLAFFGGDFDEPTYYGGPWGRSLGPWLRVLFCLPGVVIYGILGLLIYFWCQHRFAPVTGRLPLPGLRPRARPPARPPSARDRGGPP